MNACPFALYDAFSETAFGGSQAAIVTEASSIERDTRRRIARELGMPATAFVEAYDEDWVEVQFMSAVMELPMCGHGTICLLTHLLESNLISLENSSTRQVELRLPESRASVSLSQRADRRYVVMLDILPPAFAPPPRGLEWLELLGLESDALSPELPIEVARGDFVHLLVPLTGLDAMRSIRPDFSAMVEFCRAHGIETIAVFCSEVENPDSQLHVRDFCPAVGVSESAAAGTTNAAITGYLLRHQPVDGNTKNVSYRAEQGLELGRPSSIESRVSLSDGKIERLQVGGVATRVMDGQVYV